MLGLVPRLHHAGTEKHKDHGRDDVGRGTDSEHVPPLVHGAPHGGKVRHQHRRNEPAGRADKVDDPVQRSGKVGRQILRVLQVRHAGRTVEAERQGDDRDAHVRVEPGVDQTDQEQSGDDVSWNESKYTLVKHEGQT